MDRSPQCPSLHPHIRPFRFLPPTIRACGALLLFLCSTVAWSRTVTVKLRSMDESKASVTRRCPRGLADCISRHYLGDFRAADRLDPPNDTFPFEEHLEVQIHPLTRDDRGEPRVVLAVLESIDYCGTSSCSMLVLERTGPSLWRQIDELFGTEVVPISFWKDRPRPALLQFNRCGCTGHSVSLLRFREAEGYVEIAREDTLDFDGTAVFTYPALRLFHRVCPRWFAWVEEVFRTPSSPEDLPDESILPTRFPTHPSLCIGPWTYAVTTLPDSCDPPAPWGDPGDLVLVSDCRTEPCRPVFAGSGEVWRLGSGPWRALTDLCLGRPRTDTEEERKEAALCPDFDPLVSWPILDALEECPPACRHGTVSEGCIQVLHEVGGLALGVTWYAPTPDFPLPCDRVLLLL